MDNASERKEKEIKLTFDNDSDAILRFNFSVELDTDPIIISSKTLPAISKCFELTQHDITDSNIWRSGPSPAAFLLEYQANMVSTFPDLENAEMKSL